MVKRDLADVITVQYPGGLNCHHKCDHRGGSDGTTQTEAGVKPFADRGRGPKLREVAAARSYCLATPTAEGTKNRGKRVL